MMTIKLIDKSALVAEIERLKDSVPYYPTLAEKEAYKEGIDSAYCKVCDLEIKEVDLEEAAIEYCGGNKGSDARVRAGFVMGAKWCMAQMMAKAVVREVKVDAGGYPYIGDIELYDYDKDIPLAKKGDKYNVILIKED